MTLQLKFAQYSRFVRHVSAISTTLADIVQTNKVTLMLMTLICTSACDVLAQPILQLSYTSKTPHKVSRVNCSTSQIIFLLTLLFRFTCFNRLQTVSQRIAANFTLIFVFWNRLREPFKPLTFGWGPCPPHAMRVHIVMRRGKKRTLWFFYFRAQLGNVSPFSHKATFLPPPSGVQVLKHSAENIVWWAGDDNEFRAKRQMNICRCALKGARCWLCESFVWDNLSPRACGPVRCFVVIHTVVVNMHLYIMQKNVRFTAIPVGLYFRFMQT